MWPEIGGLVSPSLLLVARQPSSVQIFHFTDSVRQTLRNGTVQLLPPFQKGSTLMIKPKECPKAGGQGGRTRVLTSLHLSLSFRVLCPQQFLFQNPWRGRGGARGLPLPWGFSTWLTVGTRRGPPRAEEGRGGPPRPSPVFLFPVWFTQHCPPLAPASPGGPPLLLLFLLVHPQMNEWMGFVFWRMPK